VRGLTGERLISKSQGEARGRIDVVVKSEPKGARLKSATSNASRYGDGDISEAQGCKSIKIEAPIAKIVVKKENCRMIRLIRNLKN